MTQFLLGLESKFNDMDEDFDPDEFLNTNFNGEWLEEEEVEPLVDQDGGAVTRSQTRRTIARGDADETASSSEPQPVVQQKHGMVIKKVSRKQSRKFKVKQTTYQIEITEKETSDVDEALRLMHNRLDELVTTVTRGRPK